MDFLSFLIVVVVVGGFGWLLYSKWKKGRDSAGGGSHPGGDWGTPRDPGGPGPKLPPKLP
jgi:hypothetical protein